MKKVKPERKDKDRVVNEVLSGHVPRHSPVGSYEWAAEKCGPTDKLCHDLDGYYVDPGGDH